MALLQLRYMSIAGAATVAFVPQAFEKCIASEKRCELTPGTCNTMEVAPRAAKLNASTTYFAARS